MENDRIRKLLALMHSSNSPENRVSVEKKLGDSNFTIPDLYQKLEMEQPYVEAYRLEGFGGVNVPEHSHSFGEMIYCQSGSGVEFQVEGERFRLQRGDILIIMPGVRHGVMVGEAGENRFSGILVWISETFVPIVTNYFPDFRTPQAQSSSGVLHTAGTVWEYLGDMFRSLIAESELRRVGWESAMAGIVTVLLTEINRATLELGISERNNSRPELLELILGYVETRLAQKITLEDTANRFWVSQSTITHLFHEKMGISFYKYVTRRRLNEARNLMMEGMALEKVANRVGFGDYSAFYRAFRAEYGVSPREFRNRKYEE